MSTKVHETCPQCDRSVYPIDTPVTLQYKGSLRLWRYDCDGCGWVWANLLQRKHNAHELHKLNRWLSGGWYS